MLEPAFRIFIWSAIFAHHWMDFGGWSLTKDRRQKNYNYNKTIIYWKIASRGAEWGVWYQGQGLHYFVSHGGKGCRWQWGIFGVTLDIKKLVSHYSYLNGTLVSSADDGAVYIDTGACGGSVPVSCILLMWLYGFPEWLHRDVWPPMHCIALHCIALHCNGPLARCILYSLV